MSTPLRISDEILGPAREEAEAADRSVTAQVEHWARLGMAVERIAGHDVAMRLKRHDLARAVSAAMDRASSDAGQKEVLEFLQSRGPRYAADPKRPGGILKVDPDGTQTPGRMVNRRFVPSGD